MDIRNYYSLLSGTIFFRDLSIEYLSHVFSDLSFSIQQYNKDKFIFIEDEVCRNLSIILSGNVEIQKIDASGKVLIIAEFHEGDSFGESLIFSDRGNFPMSVMSKTGSVILHIEKDSVIKLCQKSSTFLYAYLRLISNRAMLLGTKIKEVTLKTIRQKICEFLIYEYTLEKDKKIHLTMTKKEWADKMGVQRPSLSRELIKLKDEGLIDFYKDVIELKDVESIKAYTL